MPTRAACPQCNRVLHVADELIGKKLRCKNCQAVFVVGATAKEANEPTSRQAPTSDQPRPPKKRPRQPTLKFSTSRIIALAVVGIVLVVGVMGAIWWWKNRPAKWLP